MASAKKIIVTRPTVGTNGGKGFGPAGSAGQATTVQVNPGGSVGQTGNGGGNK